MLIECYSNSHVKFKYPYEYTVFLNQKNYTSYILKCSNLIGIRIFKFLGVYIWSKMKVGRHLGGSVG